jgi:hypothetical protein
MSERFPPVGKSSSPNGLDEGRKNQMRAFPARRSPQLVGKTKCERFPPVDRPKSRPERIPTSTLSTPGPRIRYALIEFPENDS